MGVLGSEIPGFGIPCVLRGTISSKNPIRRGRSLPANVGGSFGFYDVGDFGLG